MGSERSEGVSGTDFVLGKQGREGQRIEGRARRTARTRQVYKPRAGQFGGGHMGERLKPNEAGVR